jgi:phenylacetate-CoA ligase
MPVKFIFSAEAFSEEFRDYLVEKTGINPLLDTLNHYGTVDLGTMAHETPYSIMIRRLAYQNKQVFVELFGDEARTPTFAQYDPRLFYFEEFQPGLLCCSAKTGYPLIRYDLKDRGGVRSKQQVEKLFSEHGINLEEEAEKAGISHTVWNLPFVFVYERSDFSVSYYAFQIYPEVVRKALIDKQVDQLVTGKCTMEVVFTDGRQQLMIYVELRPNVSENSEFIQKLQDLFHSYLLDGSSEYRQTCQEMGDDTIKPHVIAKRYEDIEYFRPGGKQLWVKK